MHKFQPVLSFRTLTLSLLTATLLLCLAGRPSAFAQSTDAQATPTEQYGTHTVQPNEGWGVIAQRYGISTSELKALNPQAVRYGDILRLGEQLRVPILQPVVIATEYVVQPGDGWGVIAARYGMTQQQLINANPQYVRPGLILRTGDRLAIPAVGGAAQLTVTATPVPSATMATSAPSAAQATDTPAPTETVTTPPTETATVPPTETATEIPTDTPVAPTEAVSETNVVSDTQAAPVAPVDTSTQVTESAVLTESTEATTVPTATQVPATAIPATPVAGCPTTFAEYPETLLGKVNDATSGGTDNLIGYLSECGALYNDSLVQQDWTGDSTPDIAFVYANPMTSAAYSETEMLILNSGATGYTLGYRSGQTSDALLLATYDLNSDGKADIVWRDRNCGASTCFTTVDVLSWNGSAWVRWTEGKLTMATGEVRLIDQLPEGQGQEIELTGGRYGIVAAGPQRERVDYWGSVNGEPYKLISRQFAASECIYHSVLDANAAYLNAKEDDFTQAEELYTKAYTDETLTACWTRPNEQAELKSFSLFRLALIAAKRGQSDVAQAVVESIAAEFPDSPVLPAAQAWQSAFVESGNADQACAAANSYAVENADVVDVLADYGFGNPSFQAEDFCPILVDEETNVTTDPGANAVLSDTTAITDTTIISETGVISETSALSDTAVVSGSASIAEGEVVTDTTTNPAPSGETIDSTTTDSTTISISTTEEATSEVAVSAVQTETTPASEPDTSTSATSAVSATAAPLLEPIVVADSVEIGEQAFACPVTLTDFADALPAVLQVVDADKDSIFKFLRECGAATDTRGDVLLTDVNDDGIEDAVILPTIVADLGFGPDGTQGAVLIYHGSQEGSYTLAHNPELYGLTTLLTSEDLNKDGATDLAWTVTGCSISCVIEAQIVTWDAETGSYKSMIQPGALIAEGKVEFSPVSPKDPGDGRQLLMIGGVSKLPDSGLPVPHTEVWESVEGAPFQRIRWSYDRKAKDNDCLGLRLVEADVALRASNVLSYTPALELYEAAVNDTSLRLCSIHKLEPDTELALLLGLGHFRRVQILALSGNREGAEIALANMKESRASDEYKQMAESWLSNYSASADPAAACASIQTVLATTPTLWQVTDHFGFNHPLTPAEEICFVPALLQ